MLLITAAVCFFFALVFVFDTIFGLRKMRSLGDYAAEGDFPSLSIVFAALNEERNIKSAVNSLLKIDYPNLSLIAVNDRSTDRTGEILERLAQSDSRLKVITVKELPLGWIGKNHALYQGAKATQSDLLLFTDADVHFEKTVLKRAVACLTREKWDHMAALMDFVQSGVLLNLCTGVFGMLFLSFTRPWKAEDPKSPSHLGVGAFNLIRRSVYEKIGTHEALKLRPDDDIKLGKLVKKSNYRQVVVKATGFLSVEWYPSFREFVRGLEKNIYAGSDYRFFFMVFATISLIIQFIVPYAALPFIEGPTLWLFAGTILLQMICFIAGSLSFGTGYYTIPLLPLGIILYIYVIWNAILKTLFKNGIEWRGTFYSLDELKKNVV